MKNAHKLAVLVMAAVTSVSCTRPPEIQTPAPTAAVEVSTPEAEARATAVVSTPSYERVTFSELSGGTVREGYVSVTGYTAATKTGTELRNTPPICGNTHIPVRLDESSVSAPSGRAVEVQGMLTKDTEGWILRVDSAKDVLEGTGADWNRFADTFSVYCGKSLAGAYSEYDSYMITLCTWQYMRTADGTMLTPGQAADMLEGKAPAGFTDTLSSLAGDFGSLSEVFGEFAKQASKTEKRASRALEKGEYAYNEETGMYEHTDRKDFGSEYGTERNRLCDRLAEILSTE